MENLVQVVAVPLIVSLVFFILTIYKQFVKGKKEVFMQIIPILAATLGIGLGIFAYYVVPAIMLADNVLMAILVGGASGLAATGTDQLFKQFTKKTAPKE